MAQNKFHHFLYQTLIILINYFLKFPCHQQLFFDNFQISFMMHRRVRAVACVLLPLHRPHYLSARSDKRTGPRSSRLPHDACRPHSYTPQSRYYLGHLQRSPLIFATFYDSKQRIDLCYYWIKGYLSYLVHVLYTGSVRVLYLFSQTWTQTAWSADSSCP